MTNKNCDIQLDYVEIDGKKFELRLHYDIDADYLQILIGDESDDMVNIDVDIDDELYDMLVKNARDNIEGDERIDNIKEQFGLDDD